MRRNWTMILPPYSRSHSQTRASNASRPSSCRVRPSRCEVLLDRVLRRDAGVVVARLEEDVEALHPLHADEGVAERELERVAHVQLARHVRRGMGVDEGLARGVRLGVVEAFLLPRPLPALLDALRAVERLHAHRLYGRTIR